MIVPPFEDNVSLDIDACCTPDYQNRSPNVVSGKKTTDILYFTYFVIPIISGDRFRSSHFQNDL